MKKIVSLVALMGFTAGAAHAAPSHLVRNTHGGYDVTYNYQDKAKTGWYVAGHTGLSLLNFDVKQSISDGYSFKDKLTETVFDGSLAFGRRINYFWRAELEAGYMGPANDSQEGWEYDLSVPYLMANGYYDFDNGLYVGAGLGLALPMSEIKGVYVKGGDTEKTNIAVMGALMLGYSHKLDDSLVVDLRYRLGGLSGMEQTIKTGNGSESDKVKVKSDFVLDNSFTIGLRYEF